MIRFKSLFIVPLLFVLFSSYGLTEEGKEPQKVNINTASVEELATLPGIGESIAKNIVAYREQNGNFKTVNELMNVKGIGEKKFEKMKDLITVGEETASAPKSD